MKRALTCCNMLMIGVTFIGCGAEGPPKYDLSGAITYEGQPIAGGEVNFTPDASKGNTGPGSFATIKQGRYETFDGKGVIGGPHTLTIIAYQQMPGTVSDTELRELFPPRQITVNLPKQSGTYDIVVPADAGK